MEVVTNPGGLQYTYGKVASRGMVLGIVCCTRAASAGSRYLDTYGSGELCLHRVGVEVRG